MIGLFVVVVSISDEKPLHMRLHSQVVRVHSLHAVSISDEKPLHMRPRWLGAWEQEGYQFQSQTRSRSTCDLGGPSAIAPAQYQFQSQTRSRSTCDISKPHLISVLLQVSISDEKPLHMRQPHCRRQANPRRCFNLRREAA